VYLKVSMFDEGFWKYLFDFSILILATCSAGTFYICSQRVLFRTWADSLKYIPFLMALGIGIALNNARAVFAGFFGKPGEFVRTPKFGVMARDNRWKQQAENARKSLKRVKLQPFVEFGIAIYLLGCVIMCFSTPVDPADPNQQRLTIGVPFLCLFMVGYFYVPLTTWFGHRLGKTEAELPDELLAAPIESSVGTSGRTQQAGSTPAAGYPSITTPDVPRISRQDQKA